MEIKLSIKDWHNLALVKLSDNTYAHYSTGPYSMKNRSTDVEYYFDPELHKSKQPMSNGVKKKFKELEDKIDDLTINFQEKLGSHKGFYQKYSDNLTETINRLSK